MRELKRLAEALGAPVTLATDTSDVLDGPFDGSYRMYPRGGTPVARLVALGDGKQTLSLGPMASAAAAEALEKKCGVPWLDLQLPIGVRATDAFVDALRRTAGVSVPAALEAERGRLIDMISDTAQYFHGRRVALFGDPDHLRSLTAFLLELGMEPAVVVTGTPGKKWARELSKLAPGAEVRASSDIHFLHQWIKNHPVDLLIGNTYGKYVARAEGNLPFVRLGFPILDRVGHRVFPTVGYTGALRLIEKITDALFDKRDREDPDHEVELVL
jgi:nitrogenase molybdenum-iron protein beta chain